MTQSYVCSIRRWKETHARPYIYVVVELIEIKVLNVKRFSSLSEYPFVDIPQTKMCKDRRGLKVEDWDLLPRVNAFGDSCQYFFITKC